MKQKSDFDITIGEAGSNGFKRLKLKPLRPHVSWTFDR